MAVRPEDQPPNSDDPCGVVQWLQEMEWSGEGMAESKCKWQVVCALCVEQGKRRVDLREKNRGWEAGRLALVC